MRRPIRFAFGIVGLQIAYLAVTFVIWEVLGYRSGVAVVVTGILVSLISWIVNPILCAYTAYQLLLGKRKTIAVSVFFVYLVTAFVFKYASYLIWVHASGYDSFLLTPNHNLGHSIASAIVEFVNVVGVIVAMAVFVAAFFYISRVWLKRGFAVRLVEYRNYPIPIRRVKQLLEYAVGSAADDKLSSLLSNVYSQGDSKLYVFLDDDESPLGIVGVKVQGTSAEILHIAVDEHKRKRGIGRRMIDELLAVGNHLTELTAETDHDAVEFYRRYGFNIQSLGEKYPGVERFYCRLLLA